MQASSEHGSALSASQPIIFLLCLNDRGGAELSMLRLARGLAQAGRDVTVAVYGRQRHMIYEAPFAGKGVDLGCVRTTRAFIAFYLLLRRGSYAIVLSALTHTNLAAIAAARLSLRPLRVIVTEHSIDGVQRCAVSPLFGVMVRCLYAHACNLVAVSQDLARHWRAMLPRLKVFTLYNPVVDETAGDLPPPAHIWFNDASMPVIIGIGRLKPEKNFALLVQSFALVRAQRPARLVILGEGEQRPALEALARELGVQEDVMMPGFIEDPRGWLGYAAVLVCSSTHEGFGNVIAEALACGVPVVSTDCPCGPSEILGQGRYGRLVAVNDPAAMAQAIVQTLAAPVDREALRRRAAHFTVERCIDGYAALIDNTLQPWIDV